MVEKDSDVEDLRLKSPNTPVTFMEIIHRAVKVLKAQTQILDSKLNRNAQSLSVYSF